MINKFPAKQGTYFGIDALVYICGNSVPILKSLSECGFEGISVEEKESDLQTAKALVGKKTNLIGKPFFFRCALRGSYE